MGSMLNSTASPRPRGRTTTPATRRPAPAKAGPSHSDPDYNLAVDGLEARAAIGRAAERHRDRAGPSRILLVNASPRTEHTCPGETSKGWRLAEIAREVLKAGRAQVEVLDLSRTTSEYGRHIHP